MQLTTTDTDTLHEENKQLITCMHYYFYPDIGTFYNIFIRHVFVCQFREYLNENSLFADFTSARREGTSVLLLEKLLLLSPS